MINSDVAYFDPNTYGEHGYSLIGPLLLFYKRLVIYGPVGFFIEKCYGSEDLRRTSLTPDEFIGYILKGVIIPLGFRTFFDKEARSQLYLPELRVITDFDRNLISSPSLSAKTVSVPNKFKQVRSPSLARKMMEDHPNIKERLVLEVRRGQNIPQRYKDLKQRPDLIPQHLRTIANTAEPDELLALVILYDLLNNRHVMAFQGLANVHAQDQEFKEIYRAIHRFNESDEESGQQVEIIAEILKACISEISYGRLTSEEIDEFRERHRDHFVSFISSAFKEFENTTDFLKKKEGIVGVIVDRFANMKIHLSIGFDKLAAILFSGGAVSQPISDLIYNRPKTLRSRLYHGLRTPLKRSDRWIYHFLRAKR